MAVRAWKKLKGDGALAREYAGSILRLDLDRVLWRGDSVSIRQLMDDYASYLYLQRLRDPESVARAIEDGVASTTWMQDGFAYADGWDESASRYRGLRAGKAVTVHEDDDGVLVRPEVAKRQIEAETETTGGGPGEPPTEETEEEEREREKKPKAPRAPTRFHGTVELESERVGRDASQIADEVISHLNSLVGAKVRVTLEIDASIPDGAPEQVVRTVTENCKSLKFKQQGFEED